MMSRYSTRRRLPLSARLSSTLLFVTMLLPSSLFAGGFIGAGASDPDEILHPRGYDGTGGELTVTLCLDPASIRLPEMDIPIRNVVTVWNALEATTGNLKLGGNSELQPSEIDWESTILHEVGHCLGLAHPNLATESGVASSLRNYTKTTTGSDGVYDLDPGADAVIGSADDGRGDDVNLHWYRNGVNNPFVLGGGVIDSTTYSRTLGQLPGGDSMAANADRTVSALYGVPGTEASMQQGAFTDEEQRTLGADDVATLRLGMAGLDRIQGTADDYTVRLDYVGVSSSCDMVVRLIDTSSFAFCSTSSSGLAPDHRVITNSSVTTGDFNWYFNTDLLNAGAIFSDGFELGNTSNWSDTP